MTRLCLPAAKAVVVMDDERLVLVAIRDPDCFRDVAAAFISDRDELERLRQRISDAVAQLHAAQNVHQVPFLRGAIQAALQALAD